MADPEPMNALQKWRDRFGPELARTVQRFPFSVGLVTIGAILFLIELNGSSNPSDDVLFKTFATFELTALLAVATQLAVESRVFGKIVGWIINLLGLLAIGATIFLENMALGQPFMWVPILILLTSISPALHFTREYDGRRQQNLFWWMNHRSIVSAIVAGFAYLVILLGLVIIERSVSILFGFQLEHLMYRYLLPLAGALFAPIYWFATIPNASEFRDDELNKPDFLSQAVGFLGLYIFAPFLTLYALILVAYAVQIVIQQTYPEGTIGWMVIGFICVAGLNHLLLYPKFMREKPIVAKYLRFWPFLAIVPVIMLIIAIYIRVAAFGLTPERILLLAGALWTSLIVGVGIFNRLDIRLLPALAALILLLVSFGPFNLEIWSIRDQLARFEQNYEIWKEADDDEAAQRLRGAANYLLNSKEGRTALSRELEIKGFEFDGEISREKFAALLGLPDIAPNNRPIEFVRLTNEEPLDLAGTYKFYGRVELPCCSQQLGPYEFRMDDKDLVVMRDDVQFSRYDLTTWINQQNLTVTTMRENTIKITGAEHTLYLNLHEANIDMDPDMARKVVRLDFYVFEKQTNGAD